MRRSRAASLLFILFATAGATLAGSGAWIYVKARLAQVLLEVAWRRAAAGAPSPRPWPWADTTPVARLTIARVGAHAIVLEGASGRNLAFGPAHLDGTAIPGAMGNCVISAHRDTDFAALRQVHVGDTIRLQRRDGQSFQYVVTGTAVIDRHDHWIAAPTAESRLTLLTCWPFNAVIPGGPQRYAVIGKRV